MRAIFIALLALPWLAACDDKPNAPSSSSSATPAAAPASAATSVPSAAASAADGAPTVAQLREAKKLVRPSLPWGETYDAVVALLGPHQAVDFDGILLWSAVEGDKCVKLTMEKKGDAVGMTGLMEYDKNSAGMFEKCRDKIN
jgi:hypothetical protein